METAEIRRRWLSFFEGTDHTVVPSAPLVYDDPNLLFVNAGMVPFKPYFLGQQSPPWKRATSVQKCVRTLDIEEVGKTTRHGTFFQMNGNFSFGDYFKEGAIRQAWELVTGSQAEGGLGFDPDKVWVTVLGPGLLPHLPDGDEEAAALWREIAGLPDERIQRRGVEDNYWHMGVPGPGGPCSEIYVDRGAEYGPDGGPLVDEERFLEIWNLVFMQEELSAIRSKADFDVTGELPSKNIDTGMGLERVAYLLQGVDNLYEIDEVYPVIERAEQMSGRDYGADHGADVQFRVVADHVRSGLMLMSDGVTPGNEGRGYVLRRLLRRAVRSMRLLGVQDPALTELLPISKDVMKASYPELEADFGRISQIAYAEEEAFRRTLVAGTTILDLAVDKAKERGATTLAGDQAFALHDTYGFPIDLTLEMAAEQGLEVDREGFTTLMTEQRERAKADARAKKSGHASTEVWRDLRDHGPTEFLAYETLTAEASVRGLVVDGARVPALTQGQRGMIVLDRTPFYAESGGQTADEGVIETASGAVLRVRDVQRPVKGLIAHTVEVESGELTEGAGVNAQVDPDWRVQACQAHSGTHVVHAALRQVLGPTALQSGSYNKPGYLRLDFAWNSSLSRETRSEIEEVANLALRQDLPVSAAYMTLPEARAAGALALFGETYDEQVRVVEIGGPWSRELCGGTHVRHSSQVGALTLTGESSVGSGSRRIEALVGMDALRYLARERALVSELSGLVGVRPEQLSDRVGQVLTRLKEAEKEIAAMRQAAVLSDAGALVASAEDVNGVTWLGHDAGPGVGGDDLRRLVTDLRGRLGEERPSVVAAVSAAGDRPVIVIATNAAARERGLKAGQLVKIGAQALGGNGGGKDDLAQGGGQDASQISEALTQIGRALGRA
ncbi:alanine--tRNA ligase [Ornithinimicrobium cryptoxanthini]|uniref:Alanine--tRNA ligase n=1 Tax=Ornithinimicrobium cryptoxanthini TaxID=2934161 RepID=A0ABY4YEP9_9MICO|nr:alanine--tRNA ligase [Ornithinimicrobium cryptoxanthini]USQ74991.1 alanine--tRNA ligase [Ornithinimicrobium cryptoxanthini]